MKFLALTVLAVLAISAQADRDLSMIKSKNLHVFPQIPAPFNPRIVGGEVATPHQFPYQVGLFINGVSFCGGSVLDANNILTAAHCADGARSIEVVAGAQYIQQSETNQQTIVSTDFTVHEDWNANQISDDIALVHLPTPLTLNDYVQPITLRDSGCPDTATDGATATVSGWGRPSDSTGSISPVLRWVQSNIISNSDCKSYFNIIRDTNICLDGSKGKGSCNGDSGGPLTIDGAEAGIVSFGSGWGCEWGFPTAYTRVSCYNEWIQQNRK